MGPGTKCYFGKKCKKVQNGPGTKLFGGELYGNKKYKNIKIR